MQVEVQEPVVEEVIVPGEGFLVRAAAVVGWLAVVIEAAAEGEFAEDANAAVAFEAVAYM